MIIDNFKGAELPPINTISDYLKKEFNHKTIKLSIDGGFTCPNRDGTKGYGGCIFCSESGSGDMASSGDDIAEVLDSQIDILSRKWPDAKYLAYFQSHTNTYAPVEILRKKYMDALSDSRISGIVIATRPDCLEDEPEGGMRCPRCFELRLRSTALKAMEMGVKIFATTLTVSPHKNYRIISAIGQKLAIENNLQFLDMDFKKKAGFQKSIEMSKDYNLYRQNYCGCNYARRSEVSEKKKGRKTNNE